MISSLELSRICRVSQGTVDRALHDRPGISENTKRRILAAAARHGYRPHPAARELLTGERRTIGAIAPAVNSVFFMDLMNEVRSALAADGFRFFLTPVSDEVDLITALHDFAARRARAAIVVPPGDGIRVPSPITRSMPVIALTNICRGKNVHSLMPDEVQAGRDAVDYLVQKGHTEILHLTYTRDVTAIRDRARGYAERMRQRGLRPCVMKPFVAEQLPVRVRDRGITAVFCHNDWLALSAIRCLETSGYRVPNEVSVLGVDDSPTFVELCPEITTLHYPAEDIARAAHDLVCGRSPRSVGPARVVERRSVGPPP